jgi:hypothetical protein
LGFLLLVVLVALQNDCIVDFEELQPELIATVVSQYEAKDHINGVEQPTNIG